MLAVSYIEGVVSARGMQENTIKTGRSSRVLSAPQNIVTSGVDGSGYSPGALQRIKG